MDLASGQEYIWNGDPAWWNGSAPVLFPVIGGLKAGEYSYEGKSYKLPSHGFARGSEFAVTRTGGDSAELTLMSSPKTLAAYPFDFLLAVSLQLERAGIAVRYNVANTGSARMYFSIARTLPSSCLLPAECWRTITCCSNGKRISSGGFSRTAW